MLRKFYDNLLRFGLEIILVSNEWIFYGFSNQKREKILDKPRNERAKLLEKPPEEILELSSLAELDINSFHNSHMER